MHSISIAQSAEPSEADIHLAYVWLIAFVAAFGGFLFGYDWVVIGGAKPFYEAYFRLHDPQAIAWANSSALVGCFFGSLIAGRLSDRYGRKTALAGAALLFAISSILTGWSYSFTGIHHLAHSGRRRHRPGFQHLSDLHRGNQPGALARTAGQPQSAGAGDRHSGGPDRQLAHRAARSRRAPPKR